VKVSTEKAPDSQIVLTIEVEPPELERSLDSAFQRLGSKAQVPGFRKGKAPRPILERYFGKAAILEDAIEQLAPKVATDAIAQESIDAISQPRIEVTQVDPVIVKATVDVKPDIDLGEYRSIRVTPEPAEVTPEQLENALKAVRERDASWAPVERPVELNDRLSLDWTIKEGDEVLSEDVGADYIAYEEQNYPLKGFVSQLVGMKTGEEKTYEVTTGEDEPAQRFREKTLSVTVKVQDIKAQQLPELDDEYVKGLDQGFESVEDLTNKLAENLRLQAERQSAEKTREKVMDELSSGATLEEPFGMIDQEIHSIIQDQESMLARSGISFEQYLKILGKTYDDIHEERRPDARKRVRNRLLLEKLAESEGISVSADDINNEIAETIRSSGGQGSQVAKLLDEPRARDVIERNLKVRKAFDVLVDLATEGKVKGSDDEDLDSTESDEAN